MAKTPPSTESESQLPSPEVRGLIGLFIFVHLFCVATALVAYTSPSSLEERLRGVFAPYTATLNFDLNPNVFPAGRFYFMHDTAMDSDCRIVVSGKRADGNDESLTIPMAGLWPGERWRHYQALANAAGSLPSEGNEELEAALPAAIAGSILKEWGANSGTVKILARTRLRMDQVAGNNPLSDALDVTVYEAVVKVDPRGGVNLVKKSAAAEVVPVDKGGKK